MKLAADFILIIGILLNLIAIMGLLRLKQKKLSHHLLVVFWLLILSVLIFFYADLHNLRTLRFITHFFGSNTRFLLPPLIYIYVKSIFSDSKNLLKNNCIHFIPVIINFLVYTIPISLNLQIAELLDGNIYRALIQDLYGIIYFVLSLKLFYAVNKTMKQNYSNLKEKDFLWIEKFLICFLLVLVIDLLITICEMSFGYNVFWDGYITVFFMIIAMGYLGYYGVTQSEIFLPDFLIQKHITNNGPDDKSSYLKEDEKNALKNEFYKLMNDEKLYLQPDLNLKTIADKMHISERKLSAFFNEVLNSNFYESINSFRVEEAKKILKTDVVDSHSITGIGLSCGFSSKSSFYRIFKNKTGITPSIYRTLTLMESQRKE